MHRLLVTTELLEQTNPPLPREAARHLRVLRPKTGESVELFDGAGRSRRYAFAPGATADRPLVADGELTTARQTQRPLTLFACVTKGSRWDWTIEKATELGVTRIVPVISERTIVRLSKGERPAKAERWRRIAEDAARQSDALWLPQICEAVDFRDSLELVHETTCFIGALTNPPSPSLARIVRQAAETSHKPFAVYVGPEGDFTPGELSSLMAIAHPTSFGPTVLRAETAAIFAVSAIVATLS